MAADLTKTSGSSLVEDSKRICESSRSLLNKIAAEVTPETASFENVVLPIPAVEDGAALEERIIGFYQAVSLDQEASRKVDGKNSSRNMASPGFQIRGQQLPKLDRTMVDIYADELYKPSFHVTSPLSKTLITTSPSPPNDVPAQRFQAQQTKKWRRRLSHSFVERRRRENINERIQDLSRLVPLLRLEDAKVLRAADNQHSSTPNPHVPRSIPSRERSPFRESSSLYDTSGTIFRGTCLGTPKTISPKDADLDYQESDEDNTPLFPPSEQEWNVPRAKGADLKSPVTKQTLSELDINKIVHNPKLRHDINFDPDLHFRPNLDGEKGRRKADKAAGFWETMRVQLCEYIITQYYVKAQLDEMRSSVSLDWVEKFLKSHCAPMRDDSVDEVLLELRNAKRTKDIAMLEAGLRNLGSVLEAMKLDVTNHRIRSMRPILIEDTVQLEQKYFMKKIGRERPDMLGDAVSSLDQDRYWIPNLDINKKVMEKEIEYYLGSESMVRPHTRNAGLLDLDATLRSRRYRRGRGPRQVIGLNGSDDPTDPDFFVRDFEFRSREGSPNLARCRLDSQCEVPLLVSEHWARENDRLDQISREFKDPGMMSVSGHEIQVDGILRNMVFNLRGSTVTYRRDVFVCSQLNGWADMVAGAKFMAEQFAVLFSKAKKMFAGIFSFRKEKREEKIQRKNLQKEADLEFEESERLRLERKAKEDRAKEAARQRRRKAEGQQAQNGSAAGGVH